MNTGLQGKGFKSNLLAACIQLSDLRVPNSPLVGLGLHLVTFVMLCEGVSVTTFSCFHTFLFHYHISDSTAHVARVQRRNPTWHTCSTRNTQNTQTTQTTQTTRNLRQVSFVTFSMASYSLDCCFKPLCKDLHLKSDGADSARTADTVKGKDVKGASAAAENLRNRHMHPMDCQAQTGARTQSSVAGSTLRTTQIVIMTIVVYHPSSK